MLFLDNLENKSEQIVGHESMLESTELVEDDAKGPDVTLGGVRLALTGLRAHVVGSTHHCHGCGI